MTTQSQELPSIFSLIMARKGLFFTGLALAVAAGLGYTLFAAPIWEAKATLIFPVRTPSLIGPGNFDQTSLAATLTGGPTPLKVFGGMLESERALSFVAEHAGLPRRDVKEMRSIQDQAMESSLTVSARSHDADLAKRVVALHLDALDRINQDVSRPMSSLDVDTLRQRVAEQQARVDDAEARLLEFQNRAISAPSIAAVGSGMDANFVPTGSKWAQTLKELELDEGRLSAAIDSTLRRTRSIAGQGGQLPASLPPVQKWRDRLTQMQYDLKIQELTLAPSAPELRKLREAIAVTERQLRSELDKYARAASAGMVDPGAGETDHLPGMLTQRVVVQSQIAAVRKLAKVAPAEAIELSRLTREVGTQSAILQQLQAQSEIASLNAERDPNRWQVLDEPQVEEKPVNKSFVKNGAISIAGGMALGSLLALAWPTRRSKRPAVETTEYDSAVVEAEATPTEKAA